jgi:hypothetical protein
MSGPPLLAIRDRSGAPGHRATTTKTPTKFWWPRGLPNANQD